MSKEKKVHKEAVLHNVNLHLQIPVLQLSCDVTWATVSTPLAPFCHRCNGDRQDLVRTKEHCLWEIFNGSAWLLSLSKAKGHSSGSFYTMWLVEAHVPHILTVPLIFQGDVGLRNPQHLSAQHILLRPPDVLD